MRRAQYHLIIIRSQSRPIVFIYSTMDIHYICSFGPICHTATFMWRNQLKLVSYPFDWIFTNPYVILDMLNDNFQKFLNNDYYVSKNPHDEKNKHSLYLPDL